MSLACKLDPMVRRRRAHRAAIVRNPPKFSNVKIEGARELYAKVFAELALIKLSPRLDGDTKDQLFRRGLHQLRFAGIIE